MVTKVKGNSKSKKEAFFFCPDIQFSKPISKKYTIGLAWNGKDPYYKSINGYEIYYRGQDNLEGIDIYYEKRLINLGWKKYDRFNADGPHGHACAFSKGKDLIIFTYRVEIIKNKIGTGLEGKQTRFKNLLSIFSNRKKYLF